MKADTIRWVVLALIVVGAAAGIQYRYQDTRPCVHPIPFAIGDVDARFTIAQTTLVDDAKAAAAIWNSAAGKPVLTYDPAAALKINLIYDARQATAILGTEIDRRQRAEDAARTALDALQARYTRDQSAYNDKVAALNARGGATPPEAAKLDQERAALKALAASINSQVAIYNASVAALNAEVEKFNQIAGQTFKQGEYVRDASGERIYVFEFVGTTQLERVLAHEFGHALGIDHNADPKSIMYAKNESGNLVPTASDLAALRAVCGA